MTHTLVSFTLNTAKAGKIIRELKGEHGYTNDDIDELTGISSDTVKKLISGKAALTLERAFKLCVLFKIPLESLVALLLEGENIDFADQILTYDPTKSEALPITDESVTPIADTIPETVVEAALSVPAVPVVRVPEEAPLTSGRIEDLKEEIARQDYIIRQLLDILAKR